MPLPLAPPASSPAVAGRLVDSLGRRILPPSAARRLAETGATSGCCYARAIRCSDGESTVYFALMSAFVASTVYVIGAAGEEECVTFTAFGPCVPAWGVIVTPGATQPSCGLCTSTYPPPPIWPGNPGTDLPGNEDDCGGCSTAYWLLLPGTITVAGMSGVCGCSTGDMTATKQGSEVTPICRFGGTTTWSCHGGASATGGTVLLAMVANGWELTLFKGVATLGGPPPPQTSPSSQATYFSEFDTTDECRPTAKTFNLIATDGVCDWPATINNPIRL